MRVRWPLHSTLRTLGGSHTALPTRYAPPRTTARTPRTITHTPHALHARHRTAIALLHCYARYARTTHATHATQLLHATTHATHARTHARTSLTHALATHARTRARTLITHARTHAQRTRSHAHARTHAHAPYQLHTQKYTIVIHANPCPARVLEPFVCKGFRAHARKPLSSKGSTTLVQQGFHGNRSALPQNRQYPSRRSRSLIIKYYFPLSVHYDFVSQALLWPRNRRARQELLTLRYTLPACCT